MRKQKVPESRRFVPGHRVDMNAVLLLWLSAGYEGPLQEAGTGQLQLSATAGLGVLGTGGE